MKRPIRVHMFGEPVRARTADSAALIFAIEKLAPIEKLQASSSSTIACDVEPLITRLRTAHGARIDRTGADEIALRDRLAAAWQTVAEGLDELEATVLEAEAVDRAAARPKGADAPASPVSSKTTDRGKPTSMATIVGDINKANQEFWAPQK